MMRNQVAARLLAARFQGDDETSYSTAYERQRYIQSYSETTPGLWIAHGPVYVAAIGAQAQIGRYLRDALAHLRRGIPRPAQSEWRAVQAPMLKATGARSWGKAPARWPGLKVEIGNTGSQKVARLVFDLDQVPPVAAVPDQEVQDLAFGVFGPSALEGDCGRHVVATDVVCEPSQQ